jgi:hypothetical protein
MEKKRMKEVRKEKIIKEKEKRLYDKIRSNKKLNGIDVSSLISNNDENEIDNSEDEMDEIDEFDEFDDDNDDDIEHYFFLDNKDSYLFSNFYSSITSFISSNSSYFSLLNLEEDRLLIQLLNIPMFCGDEDEIIYQLLRFNKIKVFFVLKMYI